jgi:peptide/nickel transport system permease protein
VLSVGKFVFKRLLLMIPVVIGVISLVFTIIYFTPGDAALVKLGAGASDEEIEAMRESMGLNRPYIVQLGDYLYRFFVKLDLGTSIVNGTQISSDLAKRLPNSIVLAVLAIVCSVGLGVPLGISAAVHQNRTSDTIAMIIALVGISMPGFWFGLVCVVFFSFRLHLLPAFGVGSLKFWILPIIANSFHGVAAQARQARSSMLEVIRSDYIVMARAKGLLEPKVIWKHAFPNALVPTITISGGAFGSMIGGALVIETIFGIPGVGYYLVQGVTCRDYNAVLGGVAVLSIMFSIIMLVVDLALAAIDPRIKFQFASGSRRRKKHV